MCLSFMICVCQLHVVLFSKLRIIIRYSYLEISYIQFCLTEQTTNIDTYNDPIAVEQAREQCVSYVCMHTCMYIYEVFIYVHLYLCHDLSMYCNAIQYKTSFFIINSKCMIID